MDQLWTLAILFPSLGAALALLRKLGPVSTGLVAALGAAPALAMGLSGALWDAEVSWILLGASFGIDKVSSIFLLFTGAIWFACALFSVSTTKSDPRRGSYLFFFMLTMTGNIGLILARDVVAFYCFFTLMTFAAYGLVVHMRSGRTRRAGRVYIVMAISGELLFLAGLLIAVAEGAGLLMADFVEHVAASQSRDLTMTMLFFGLGVKAGIIPVHVWLPLAHPVAPTPASAVLSGAMIKAGLYGWIVLLPIGAVSPTMLAPLVIAIGLFGAFGAALYGLLQRNPKTVLAYSSVSQMGVMVIGVGAAMAAPAHWPYILGALTVYTCSHGFGKAALFLTVDVAKKAGGRAIHERLTLLCLIVAALAVAGAPPLGGAIAKKSLKTGVAATETPWSAMLGLLITLTAATTTMLLGHFLLLIRESMRAQERSPNGRLSPWVWAPWGALTLAAASAGWLISPPVAAVSDAPAAGAPRPGLADAIDALWPVALGAAALWAGALLLRSIRRRPGAPAGDLLWVYMVALRAAIGAGRHTRLPGPTRWKIDMVPVVLDFVERGRHGQAATNIERAMKAWPVAGTIFVILVITLAAMVVL